MGETVVGNPVGQGFGQTVSNRLVNGAGHKWVNSAHEVIQRHAWLRLAAYVLSQRLFIEFASQEVAQVVIHELGIVSVITTAAMHVAERVMQGGGERAGDHPRGRRRAR